MWTIKRVVKAGPYLYASVSDHPRANKNGYVYMHRIVMENCLDRLLSEEEVVHHKNGHTHDNRIENLQVMINGEHTTHHGSRGKRFLMLRCPHCDKEFHRERRKTHIRTGSFSKMMLTCCTPSCSSKLARLIEKIGITDEIRSRMANNIIGEYILGGEDFIPFQHTGEPECFEDYKKLYNIKIEPLLHKCPVCDNMCSRTKYCSPECAKFSTRKANRPSKDELQQLLVNCTYDSLGELYGVSGSAIRKWCKAYGLPYKRNTKSH